MAAALLRRLHPDWEVRSAGLAANAGQTASEHAVTVMKTRGLDLSEHRSAVVDRNLLEWADRVLCMTRAHERRLVAQFPEVAGKIGTVAEEVQDPYGGRLEDYEASASQLERLLRQA